MSRAVVLSAGLPGRSVDSEHLVDLEGLISIEEAIVSAARAVFAHGGQLALPADPIVTPVVSQIAVEYAPPVQAETVREPGAAPLRVFMTERPDQQLSEILHPLISRGAASLEVRGEERTSWAEEDAKRHRVNGWMIERTQPVGAIVLGGASESVDDVRELRMADVEVALIGPAIVRGLDRHQLEQLGAHDVVPTILDDVTRRHRDFELPEVHETPYPLVMQVLAARWLGEGREERDELERLAEAVHIVYCEKRLEEGAVWAAPTDDYLWRHPELQPFAKVMRFRRAAATGRPSRALVAYSDLPEDLKEQNREFARDIPNKLNRVGRIMRPAQLGDPPFVFTEEEIEDLAEHEHDRRMREKLKAGWRWGPKEDEGKKEDPYLVPWRELPEEVKDWDRWLVRSIPKILAVAGYTINRRS